jgi:hypothetical protein
MSLGWARKADYSQPTPRNAVNLLMLMDFPFQKNEYVDERFPIVAL